LARKPLAAYNPKSVEKVWGRKPIVEGNCRAALSKRMISWSL